MGTVKTASARVRINPETKEQAEAILKTLGLSVSGAFELFYRQVIAHRGLPFDVRIPNKKTIDAIERSKQGKGKRFKNTKDLYKDLGIDE